MSTNFYVLDGLCVLHAHEHGQLVFELAVDLFVREVSLLDLDLDSEQPDLGDLTQQSQGF